MLAELTQAVLRVEQNQLAIGQVIRSLDERVRVLSAQQARLVELLTPEQKPKKGGPGLDELLAEMIVRTDQQNYLLKDVSDTVSKAVQPPSSGPGEMLVQHGQGRLM